ncbi:MAG: hypothetical protein KAW56_07100 [Candidatus Marinimicrobia bacterium]|nr:hypothetical protein [Candidatus Neomarinimicrobiota bacterium]
MIKKGGGGIIDKVEIRCKAILKDGRLCNRKFFVGSPGFDIFGKPKEIIVKCPKCGNYNIITCEIREEIIVRVKE